MEPKTFYVGIKGVIVSKGRALIMQKYDNNGKQFWDIPGGRIGEAETINETLNRELREEVLNIGKFKVGKLLSAYKLPRLLKDGQGLILLFYKVEASLGDLVQTSKEHHGYKWVNKIEIPSLNSEECYIEPGYEEALVLALS